MIKIVRLDGGESENNVLMFSHFLSYLHGWECSLLSEIAEFQYVRVYQ